MSSGFFYVCLRCRCRMPETKIGKNSCTQSTKTGYENYLKFLVLLSQNKLETGRKF